MRTYTKLDQLALEHAKRVERRNSWLQNNVSAVAGAWNAARGPSPGLWQSFPKGNISMDPNEGQIIHEDFETWPTHASTSAGAVTAYIKGWNVFLSQHGALADSGIANVSGLGYTSTTAAETLVLQPATGAMQIALNSGRKVGFEVRLRSTTIATVLSDVLVGLMKVITPPTATSHLTGGALVSTADFIGFQKLNATGNAFDIQFQANGQTKNAWGAAAAPIVANTFTKLGFYFDGISTVTFFQDGVKIGNAITSVPPVSSVKIDGVTFPKSVNLAPTICVQIAGATPGTIHFDWIRAGMTNVGGD